MTNTTVLAKFDQIEAARLDEVRREREERRIQIRIEEAVRDGSAPMLRENLIRMAAFRFAYEGTRYQHGALARLMTEHYREGRERSLDVSAIGSAIGGSGSSA